VALIAQGFVSSTSGWETSGYRPVTAPVAQAEKTSLEFIPYHLWANRGTSSMRVHVPHHRAIPLELG
jgi:DUF1680 family protein